MSVLVYGGEGVFGHLYQKNFFFCGHMQRVSFVFAIKVSTIFFLPLYYSDLNRLRPYNIIMYLVNTYYLYTRKYWICRY